MKREKKFTALALAVVMGLSSITIPTKTVKAEETPQEYVVVAKNNTGYKEIEETYSDEIPQESVESEVLKENNIAVVELTETEAEKLEEDQKILIVEENIILEGSGLKQDSNIKKAERKSHRQKKKEKEEKLKALESMDIEVETANTEAEYEWNLQAINAEELAEEEVEEQQKIKIAVLDSGVDYVSGINLTGYVNFVDDADEISEIFQDMTGHGTGIASIIAGNGKNGIYGVNPNAEVYSVKIMDENNKASLSHVIEGIYWCIENDIDIINMSFGTAVYSKALEQAVADAYDAGLLLVAAAGNGNGEVEYPAAFSQVMAVAATTPEAEISDFSNTGEELDVAAPGEKIRVASFFNGNVVTHGTSIAVPHVVGVASLLWEKDTKKSNEFIRQLINCSAKEIEGTDECGLLDAEYALNMYETFAENFDETRIEKENPVPENTAKVEKFEEINTDETYVEGRWAGRDHKAAVGDAFPGFTTYQLIALKAGCVFPDKYAEWKADDEKPYWHGLWRRAEGELINYVTICEMITDTAVNNGEVDSYSYFKELGMDRTTYNTVKRCINELQADYPYELAKYNCTDTPENRKLLLFGCGLHTITDAFAHSTARKVDGEYVRIYHKEGEADDADTTSYYYNRYDIACRITEYAMECLLENLYVDGTEVLKAVKTELTNETPYFRVIDLEPNVKANIGSTNAEVKKVSIKSSATKLKNGQWAN